MTDNPQADRPFRDEPTEVLQAAAGLAATHASQAARFRPAREGDSLPAVVGLFTAELQRRGAVTMADSTTTCRTCVTPIGYVDCPTGGWWAHDQHPADDHDAIPAAWVDGDPLMEAIADAVWEHCAIEGTASLVVDDPRNIAGTAAAVARRLLTPPAALPSAPADRAALLREAADLCDEAGAVYASKALNDHADGAFTLMERFLRKADEAEYVATPCSIGGCEPGGQPCSTHERLMAHAEGDHELCGPGCGTSPSRMADEAQQPEALPATPEAPPVCEGFQWIGQSFATCERCGQPAWDHAGEEVAVEGAGVFDTRRTVRPWKPGQADAIRAKWEQPAAVSQPGKEA